MSSLTFKEMLSLFHMRNPKIAIILASIYLLVFTLLGQLNTEVSLMLLLFSFSPFLVIWMVYTVLKFGTWSGKELKEGEEWGYEDFIKK